MRRVQVGGSRVVSHELMAPTLHSPRNRSQSETPEAAQQGRQLREAAEAGDVELLQSLLEEGADVNQVNWYGRSALMAATQSGNAQVTRLLVEARAHVNVQVPTAPLSPHIDLAACCCSAPWPCVTHVSWFCCVQNKTGWTCLMYASCNGHGELVSYLLRSAACDTQLRESVRTAPAF